MNTPRLVPMLLCAAVATASHALAIDAQTWKAVATSGTVDARALGDAEPSWRKIARGARLAAHSDVRTGWRGRATLTDQASVLMIDPASEVRLPAAGDPPHVMQHKGTVIYEVDGTKVQGFEVVTPFLVAGVKGTKFLVTVEARLAAVTVEHGVVTVRRVGSDEVVEIRAGETAVFDAAGAAEIQVIHAAGHGVRADAGTSDRALEIAERGERKLDERAAGAAGILGGDLVEGADRLLSGSLLDAGADVICDPVDAIDDPVRGIIDPIVTPPGSSPGNVLDPLGGLMRGILPPGF